MIGIFNDDNTINNHDVFYLRNNLTLVLNFNKLNIYFVV